MFTARTLTLGLLGLLLTLGTGSVLGRAFGARVRTRAVQGDYQLVVAGSFSGTGSASYRSDLIDFTNCRVVAANGDVYHFVGSTHLPVVNGYFSGQLRLNSRGRFLDVDFSGRLDQPAAAEASTISPRLTCTFKSADGRGARIVGILTQAR